MPHQATREHEEQLVQRLYYRQQELAAQREEERQATLRRSRSQNKRTISRADEDKLVTRIYDQQLERLQHSKKERERKVEEETHRTDKRLPQSEIDNQVHRMYEEELEKSRRRREEVEKRYHPTQPTKKISKKVLDECVTRLHHIDWEKRDEELFQKYVYPYDPKVSAMSREQEELMATRLSTRGSS